MVQFEENAWLLCMKMQEAKTNLKAEISNRYFKLGMRDGDCRSRIEAVLLLKKKEGEK